jgi:hypothetical protein
MATTDATRTVELTISAEKLCFLVVKAREFDVKTGVIEADPGSNPVDSGMSEVLGDYTGDATLTELKDAIEALNDDEAADVIAMVWLGRGDYDAEEWLEARRLARERNQQGSAGEYLTGIPLLADHLEEGFSMLGHSCADIEADHL